MSHKNVLTFPFAGLEPRYRYINISIESRALYARSLLSCVEYLRAVERKTRIRLLLRNSYLYAMLAEWPSLLLPKNGGNLVGSMRHAFPQAALRFRLPT